MKLPTAAQISAGLSQAPTVGPSGASVASGAMSFIKEPSFAVWLSDGFCATEFSEEGKLCFGRDGTVGDVIHIRPVPGRMSTCTYMDDIRGIVECNLILSLRGGCG